MHLDDEQPGLIVLRICSSSQLFVAHRKSEASTVHLCAVCLFLWFKVENLEIILSSSWTFLGSTVLGPMGVQLFHRQSLYFRKKTSSGEPCISATTCLGVGGLGFSWFNPRCSVAGCGPLTLPWFMNVSLCTHSSNKVWILIKQRWILPRIYFIIWIFTIHPIIHEYRQSPPVVWH